MTDNTAAAQNATRTARPTFRELSFSKKIGWGVALLFALISAIYVWVGVANLFEAIATPPSRGWSSSARSPHPW
jgi:hypothetical protein